jgi:hypothetical protein
VKAYWIPIVGTGWKLQKPEPRNVNTLMTAETDGFLHGAIQATDDNTIGTLKLYAGADAAAAAPSPVAGAAASVQNTGGLHGVRGVPWSSVILPVQKGAQYKGVYAAGSGSPTVSLFWTAIVPA